MHIQIGDEIYIMYTYSADIVMRDQRMSNVVNGCQILEKKYKQIFACMLRSPLQTL